VELRMTSAFIPDGSSAGGDKAAKAEAKENDQKARSLLG